MKRYFLSLAAILFFAFTNLLAQSAMDTARNWPQNVTENMTEDTTVYTRVQVMPVFPGGSDSLKSFLARNVKYPAQALKDSVNGRVFISFVVTKEGKVTQAKVLRGIGRGCDEEALRVVMMMPNWIPGKQGDKAVNVSIYQPVNFSLSSNTKETKKK